MEVIMWVSHTLKQVDINVKKKFKYQQNVRAISDFEIKYSSTFCPSLWGSLAELTASVPGLSSSDTTQRTDCYLVTGR